MLMNFTIVGRGMKTMQELFQNIQMNMANAQVTGYKEQRANTENTFPIYLNEAVAENAKESFNQTGGYLKRVQYGTGSRVNSISRQLNEGPIENTKRELDIAIVGEGYFRFQRPDGSIVYSRAGNLRKDSEGNLVSSSGFQIFPPIKVPVQATELSIQNDGKVYVKVGDLPYPREIGQITLATFSNPQGLIPINDNMYVATTDSGEAVVEAPGQALTGTVQQFSLEGSNVNILNQMMAMVINQRNFSAASKAFQISDAMLKAGIQ